MADITASALTPTAVAAAVSLASPGDTVVMPSGTATSWSTSVSIPAGISLRGQGVGSTIIQQSSGTNTFFYFNSSRDTTAYTTEISDFRCTGGGTATSTGYGIRINSLPEIYIHDIWVEEKSTVLLALDSVTKGVICDSTFKYSILESSPGSGGYGVACKGTYPYNWPSIYPTLGTENTIFIEDCTLYGIKHAIQAQDCGHFVVRYNDISGGWSTHPLVDVHGARDTEGEDSSGLMLEVYNNTIGLDRCDRDGTSDHCSGVMVRGGCGVIYSNTFEDSSSRCVIVSNLDINTHDTPVYSYPDDYPIIWQPRNVYAWSNVYGASSVSITNEAGNWCQEDRSSTNSMGTYYDYVNSTKSGYVAFAYPHPLRPTSGGGTYKIQEGIKLVIS